MRQPGHSPGNPSPPPRAAVFSLTFFWRGFTGLAVAVGAVLTLFLVMQMTGRVDWARLGRGARPAGEAAPPA